MPAVGLIPNNTTSCLTVTEAYNSNMLYFSMCCMGKTTYYSSLTGRSGDSEHRIVVNDERAGEGRRSARHLLHIFPSFAIGGSQSRFRQLAIVHGDRYRHTIVALDGVFDMAPSIPPELASFIKPEFDKRAGLKNLPLIRKTLKRQKPDVLVTYNWGAIEWGLANRYFPLVPHVHIEDGFGPEEKDRQFARRVWLRRIALTGKHTRVVLPSHQLERIASKIWRLPERSILYLPNGVDCTRFRQTKTTVNKGALVIGTIATLRPEKNLSRLIRAFAAVAEEQLPTAIQLVIVGDGPERSALEAIARETGRSAQIFFQGATRAPEQALAEMDVFALSSVTEQMPLGILEAMASGLPICSVAVGDVADMVAEENRPYIVALDNETGFRNSLRSLIMDGDLRGRLGRANRTAALSRFDHSLMAARYLDLFG